MGEYSYDLHIHSCLSPCGDDDSTPANIAALADLLGLDIVALTDHNTCKNCPAFFEAARNYSFLPIAGMELTTEEEIHVVCLFPTLEKALAFDEFVHEKIMPIPNKPEIFGNQLIMNSDDTVCGTEEICLINATSIDLYSLIGLVKKYGGICFPAHIDRSSFSLLSSLGFIPEDLGIETVEIRYKEAVDNLKNQHPYLQNCKIVHDSDAHTLENISLPENFLTLEEKTVPAVLKVLCSTYE
ncbi:MAG: PHP domain-containing protein [Ruminiclostridium sp.]